MSETIKGHRNRLLKWKEAIESKGLKANHGKGKIMVSGGITMDGRSKSKVDPSRVCSLRIKANSFSAYSAVSACTVHMLE